LPACSSLAPLALGEGSKPAQASADARSELQKARQYWGEAYAKNPKDAQVALNYARDLRALGEKRQALAVLEQAWQNNPEHRGIASEYGRGALELDRTTLAKKLLEHADDPTNPDWRVISARGTVLAKQGKYGEAIPYYEKALALAPNQASLLNNLALAEAMEGHADKAEPLLRRALASGGYEAKVNQNLALVLGLQRKYDEAKMTVARQEPAERAAADVEYVHKLVQLPAQLLPKTWPRRNATPPALPIGARKRPPAGKLQRVSLAAGSHKLQRPLSASADRRASVLAQHAQDRR
jgi:Flp pilus assembly protein TadD